MWQQPGGEPAGDTSDDAVALQRRRWREMSDEEKGALVVALSRATQQMAEAGVAARHPQASARERFLRLAILRLGRTLAEEVYPEVRDLQP